MEVRKRLAETRLCVSFTTPPSREQGCKGKDSVRLLQAASS